MDEEVMDYTSELVFQSVTVFFHPICYLKTQRYKCIQSGFYWYFYIDVEICLRLGEEQINLFGLLDGFYVWQLAV